MRLKANETFVDLGSTVWRDENLSVPDHDWQATRYDAISDGEVVSAGILKLNALSGQILASNTDQCLIVLAGALTVSVADQTVSAGVGSGIVIPCGAKVQWSAAIGTQCAFLRHAGVAGDVAIASIIAGGELVPSGAPLAELLISETPQCRNRTDFRSADCIFTAGTWDSTPYHRRAMRYAHFEMMHLTRGSVTLEDDQGMTQRFGAGQTVLLIKGSNCAWESTEYVEKLFAIVRPTA